MHGEQDKDQLKVKSAAESIQQINSAVNGTRNDRNHNCNSFKPQFSLLLFIFYTLLILYKVYCFNLTIDSSNALALVSQFDCIVDCTDNVATRYLLNDAAFLSRPGRRIPLVSGAALRWDGQVTTYNGDSCCYRCVHPNPPPPETVTNCSDGGVVGAVCYGIRKPVSELLDTKFSN